MSLARADDEHTRVEVGMRRMKLFLLAVLLVGGAGLLPAPVVQAGPPPDELVKNVANDLLAIVREDKALRAGDTSRMAQLLEEKIVPHFDFPRMTRLAVGRSWRQATPEQQAQLVSEFRTLLVRSYSSAYSAYNHIVVDVKPLKLQPSDEDVQVKTQIRLPGVLRRLVSTTAWSATRRTGRSTT